MRMALIIGSTLILASQAQANPVDYCAAYARDFADQVQKQDVQWQHRYDNAEKSCLSRFSSTEKPIPKSKPKQVAAKKPVAPVIAAAPKLQPEPATPQIATAIPKLEPGSPDWTEYCKNKYVSFNEAKGTYLSKTGIERKCLVTTD